MELINLAGIALLALLIRKLVWCPHVPGGFPSDEEGCRQGHFHGRKK